jgi:hypothetical protein
MFSMHLVLTDVVRLQGPKGIKPHVQGYHVPLDPTRAHSLEKSWSEVEPGRGRSHGAELVRIDSLVTFDIPCVPVYIRRQWHCTALEKRHVQILDVSSSLENTSTCRCSINDVKGQPAVNRQ